MKSEKGFLRIIIALVLIYLFFIVGKTLYQSYQIRKEITALAADIEVVKENNKKLQENILYYQSDSYKERIARERLGLQKPGENVIVILPEAKATVQEKDPYDELNSPQKWWQFFFKA